MTLRLALIFSTTGSYGALGQTALAGALGAIETQHRRGAGHDARVSAGLELRLGVKDAAAGPRLPDRPRDRSTGRASRAARGADARTCPPRDPRIGPDCVIDSLIGPSNTSFLQELAAHADRAPIRAPSFTQSEADLAEIGPTAEGLVSAGSFFEANAGDTLRDAARRHAPNGRVSSFLATSFAAIEILSAAVDRIGTDEPATVFRAAAATPAVTAMGIIPIDPVLRHAMLTPRRAIARDGRFDIVQSAAHSVAVDHYLTALPAGRQRPAPAPRRRLRIVK